MKKYSPDLLPTIRAVQDQFVDLERPPASALIGVDELAVPEILIEVDAIAGISKPADAVAKSTAS